MRIFRNSVDQGQWNGLNFRDGVASQPAASQAHLAADVLDVLVGVSRARLLDEAQGLVVQTFDRIASSAAPFLMIDGTAYFCLVPLVAGDVITNISVAVTTGGTATSLSKVGLYDLAGNRLALSADQGSAWNSTGIKTVALTAPFTVLVTGGYYLAVIAKTGTTMPTVAKGQSGAVFLAPVGAGAGAAGAQTAQTDLPSPATITFGAAANTSVWLAAS